MLLSKTLGLLGATDGRKRSRRPAAVSAAAPAAAAAAAAPAAGPDAAAVPVPHLAGGAAVPKAARARSVRPPGPSVSKGRVGQGMAARHAVASTSCQKCGSDVWDERLDGGTVCGVCGFEKSTASLESHTQFTSSGCPSDPPTSCSPCPAPNRALYTAACRQVSLPCSVPYSCHWPDGWQGRPVQRDRRAQSKERGRTRGDLPTERPARGQEHRAAA